MILHKPENNIMTMISVCEGCGTTLTHKVDLTTVGKVFKLPKCCSECAEKKQKLEERKNMYMDELKDALNGEFTDDAIELMVATLLAFDLTTKDTIMAALEKCAGREFNIR